jgi:predicted nucleic acid-binding protein
MTNQPSGVVLDTNVFVAAGFNPQSNAAKIVQRVREGELKLIWNAATRSETRTVLRRIPPLRWETYEELFLPDGEYKGLTGSAAFVAIQDPDDRRFAALAAVTDAPLVSNDYHLLSVRDVLAIRVYTTGEFLAMLMDSAPTD